MSDEDQQYFVSELLEHHEHGDCTRHVFGYHGNDGPLHH